MATMQEYLEEMARRQATGWTPGVPNRFAVPVSTTWNLPSTARTTMRQVVPKANLGDISAQSNVKSTTKRRGRPRTTADKLQSISDRAGTGTIKPMLGAISKIAGPAGIAAELLRSEPAVASELAPGINPTDFRNTQAYPSMNVDEGYPNISTLPSFDIAPDAGGAVGGYPTMDADYGTMATEESDYVPADPTGGLIDVDALAGRFDVGPTSMAQVGTNAFGIPDKSYGPVTVTETSMRNADQLHSNVDAMINKLGNTGALSGTAQDYGYSHPFQTAWYDHPYMDSDDAMFSQGMKQTQDYQDYGPFSALGYSVGQPIDELSKALGLRGSLQPASIAGTVAQMAFPMAGVQQDNIPALVDDIVERNVLNPYGFENPLATSALASPTITAQDQINAYNAASMGAIASHPGQGGYIGDTERTIGEHLAAVNERVQAMPAVTTSQALSTQDERQQAMPSASEQAAARAEITRQAVINAQMAQEAAGRQRQQQAAIDAHIAASVMASRQDAMPQAPAGPTPAQIAAQIAAAEQSHRDQQASARQALKDFYASRDFQEGGMTAEEAGLIEEATGVDTFGSGNPFAEQGGGYQGGYADMGGFEGAR